MDLKKIHELPAGESIQDGYELPISTGANAGDVKRFSMAILKAWITTFVNTLIAGIAQGPAGPAGSPGAQGIQGQKGDKGDRGDAGAQGLKGDTGPAGPIGIQGAKGDKGDKGDKGNQGTQGIQGVKGDQGEAGFGIPIGGTAGQILSKVDGVDFNTTWIPANFIKLGNTMPQVGGFWVQGTSYLDGNLRTWSLAPQSDNNYALGSPTLKYANIYSTRLKIGDNTAAQENSAAVQFDSANPRGIVIPRMTQAARLGMFQVGDGTDGLGNITSWNPVDGLMVYQTDGNAGYYFFKGIYGSGGDWKKIYDDDDISTLMAFKNYSTYTAMTSGSLTKKTLITVLNDETNAGKETQYLYTGTKYVWLVTQDI